jgi:hypothetical protein
MMSYRQNSSKSIRNIVETEAKSIYLVHIYTAAHFAVLVQALQ